MPPLTIECITTAHTQNILGLFPYVFTPTAHIVVTFGLSLSIMIGVTILRFLTFKIEYLSILVPESVPLILAPFLVQPPL